MSVGYPSQLLNIPMQIELTLGYLLVEIVPTPLPLIEKPCHDFLALKGDLKLKV